MVPDIDALVGILRHEQLHAECGRTRSPAVLDEAITYFVFRDRDYSSLGNSRTGE